MNRSKLEIEEINRIDACYTGKHSYELVKVIRVSNI